MGKKTKTQEEHEAEVVELMSRAKSLADKVFGALSDNLAVREIANWLAGAEDEEDFTVDLMRNLEHAKAIYGTPTPSPEQVFDVMDRSFPIEDEDED